MVVFVLLPLACRAGKLSISRILLPVDTGTPSSMELHVIEGGCYKWTSSRPDLIEVRSEQTGCSTKAFVVGVSKKASPATVTIEAKDPETGLTLLCQAVVLDIASIHVKTVARELYLDDNPVAFEITALDHQGNQFSSINALSFEWSVEADHSADSSPYGRVLRFLTYAESPYEAPDANIQEMEKHGSRGHVVLVEALHVGSAVLKAKLADSVFKNVEPVSVKISVIANLVLSPSIFYLVPQSRVQLKLSQIKRGQFNVLPLPSAQYHFQSSNMSVCVLDEDLGIVTAQKLGSSEIVLKNMKYPETMHPTMSVLHVVLPAYISIVAVPKSYPESGSFAFVAGEIYEIIIEVYSMNDQLIYPSEGLQVDVDFPHHFRVLSRTSNGTYSVIQANALGASEIVATLNTKNLVANGNYEEVTGTAKYEVFSRVQIKPKKVMLPHDSSSGNVYQIAFAATGGDGQYNWIARNGSRLAVSERGIAKISSSASDGVVEVTMLRNSNNKDSAEIRLGPAVAMEILGGPREAVIGSKLQLSVALYPTKITSSAITFTQCQFFPLDVTTSDPEHFTSGEPRSSESSVGSACSLIDIEGSVVGFPTVSIAGRTVENALLKSSTVVGFFEKLRLKDHQEIVLAIASKFNLKFVGGPHPWVANPGYHYAKATSGNESLLAVKKSATDIGMGDYSVELACLDLGETTITLVVGNLPSKSLPSPVEDSVTVKIFCEVPKSVELSIDQNQANVARGLCPVMASSGKVSPPTVPAFCSETTNFIARVLDSQGRQFTSVSSLGIHWTASSNSKQLKLGTESGTLGEEKMVGVLKNSLIPGGSPGQVTVQIIIESYRSDSSVGKVHWREYAPMTAALALNLVERVSLMPSKVSIFNHPMNVANIGIRGGSGVFNVTSQCSDLVAKLNQQLRVIDLTPVRDGACEVKIVDLCLPAESSAVVSVSGVGRIELQSVSKVEVGNSVLASATIYDKRGFLIEGESLSFLKLKPLLSGNFLRVEISPLEKHSSEFLLKIDGLAIGQATLALEAGNLKSNSVNINVFPALKLVPRNITLVPGSILQVEATGGPSPAGALQFSIKDVHREKNDRSNLPVATVTDSGIVKAHRLGIALLRAESHGMETTSTRSASSSDDRLTVYSFHEIYVHVVNLTGIFLHVPVETLELGSEMPALVIGHRDFSKLTPMVFGASNPELRVEWSVVPSAAAVVLSGPLSNANIRDVGDVNRFAVRVHAVAPGEVQLRVTVKSLVASNDRHSNQIYMNRVLQEVVKITVVDHLLSHPPSSPGAAIFITPNTRLVLQSNKIANEKVQFFPKDSLDAAALTSDGVLTTGSQSLETLALLKDSTHRAVALLISIKPYHYLMASASRRLRVDSIGDVHSIPVGHQVNLQISFRDELGRQFHAVTASVRHQLSRYDVARVLWATTKEDNKTDPNVLLVECLKRGEAVLHVWDANDPKMEDFARISCDSFIAPIEITATVGDAVCFDSPLLFSGRPGSWTSSSDRILFVSRKDGVGVAKEPGKVVIYYGGVDGEAKTHVTLDVLPPSEIKLVQDPQIRGLSLAVNAVVEIPIQVTPSGLVSEKSLRTKFCTDDKVAPSVPHVPFTCHGKFDRSFSSTSLKLDSFFGVKARLNPIVGGVECIVSRREGLGIVESEELARLNPVILVWATLDGRNELVSNEVELPLYPAFTVNAGLSISSGDTTAILNITATERVFASIVVTPSNENYLDVRPVTKDPFGAFWLIPVHVTSAYWKKVGLEQTPLSISLTSPLTGQRLIVPVEIVLVGSDAEAIRKCAIRDTGSWLESGFNSLLVSNVLFVGEAVLVVVLIFVAYQFLVVGRWGAAPMSAAQTSFVSPSWSPGRGGGGGGSSPSQVMQSPVAGSASYYAGTPLFGSARKRNLYPVASPSGGF
ncbi:unnamed protein product [Notodromas monacha]|uniref:Nuclear pore membrane glycoprotein 210 n=1 Tax=Notodromas monacha TaxID=399045 RepID=A0A7R9BKT1_9CRUS|nr:unnamed protein product [Notodromas monacha]CAG0915814.1 unnamed protein product [Notodromas monacha]